MRPVGALYLLGLAFSRPLSDHEPRVAVRPPSTLGPPDPGPRRSGSCRNRGRRRGPLRVSAIPRVGCLRVIDDASVSSHPEEVPSEPSSSVSRKTAGEIQRPETLTASAMSSRSVPRPQRAAPAPYRYIPPPSSSSLDADPRCLTIPCRNPSLASSSSRVTSGWIRVSTRTVSGAFW